MRKSKQVVLTILPILAASFVIGCGDKQESVQRTCLDPDGNKVPIENCEQMYSNHGAYPGHPAWFYYWYYARPSDMQYDREGHVVVVPGRGSYVAPEGVSFGAGEAIGSVSRGGFGGTVGGAGE